MEIYTFKFVNQIKSVLVTFLGSWQNTMTKSTHKRKHLIWGPMIPEGWSPQLSQWRAWQQASHWGSSSEFISNLQPWGRESDSKLEISKPQSPPLETHLFQQSHSFQSFPNSPTNYRPSIQTCEPTGAILIQTTTTSFLWETAAEQSFSTLRLSIFLIGRYKAERPVAGQGVRWDSQTENDGKKEGGVQPPREQVYKKWGNKPCVTWQGINRNMG